MLRDLFRKFIVAITSSTVFCLILAIISYTPQSERLVNHGYFSFKDLFLVYFIYTLPIYLIGGILSAIVIEQLIRSFKIRDNYFIQVALYTIFGIIVGVGLLLILFSADMLDTLGYFGMCIAASLLYYHVSLLFRGLGYR